jgi:hypothetical protein
MIAVAEPKIWKTTRRKGVGSWETGGNFMFEIRSLDTSGSVILKRMSFEAALKKARELIDDGCWDVHIVDPDGRVYTSLDELAA